MTAVVLAANNGEIGGGEVMLLSLAEALRTLGHEVQVVAQGAQSLGERQQHDLAAADLAVVGGQHDGGHDRPATAR